MAGLRCCRAAVSMGTLCSECSKPVAGCDCPASIRAAQRGWVLTITGRIPMSMNQRERCSHWYRNRERAELTTLLKYLALAERVPQASGRRSVRVTIHKTMRSRVKDDPANRDSRAKSILDALTSLGLLVDDNEKWLDWRGVVEGERQKELATVVEIREVAS